MNFFLGKGYSVAASEPYAIASYSPSEGNFSANKSKRVKDYIPYYIFQKIKLDKLLVDALVILFGNFNALIKNHPSFLYEKAYFIYDDSFNKNLSRLNDKFQKDELLKKINYIREKTSSDIICLCRINGYVLPKKTVLDFVGKFAVGITTGVYIDTLPKTTIIRYMLIDSKNGQIIFFAEGGMPISPVKREVKRIVYETLKNFPEKKRPVRHYFKKIGDYEEIGDYKKILGN